MLSTFLITATLDRDGFSLLFKELMVLQQSEHIQSLLLLTHCLQNAYQIVYIATYVDEVHIVLNQG